MKIHKYTRLRDVNNALADFEKNRVKVFDVKIVYEGEKYLPSYYVFVNLKKEEEESETCSSGRPVKPSSKSGTPVRKG